MEDDKYAQKYLKQILFALNEDDGQDINMACDIINKIYQDGYEDGANSEREEQEREDWKQGKTSLQD